LERYDGGTGALAYLQPAKAKQARFPVLAESCFVLPLRAMELLVISKKAMVLALKGEIGIPRYRILAPGRKHQNSGVVATGGH